MRIRNVFLASIGLCGAALFFACGDASFSADGGDGGSADATAGDGSVDGNPGRGDGSTGPEGGGVDAAMPCDPKTIVAEKDKMVDCPATTSELGQHCNVESGGTCCFADDQGVCNGTGSCPGAAKWQCEKAADCTSAQCCLLADAGDPTSCPATALLSSSSCGNAGCPTGSQVMCQAENECVTALGTPHCRPLFVRFFADSDAGALVGVCVP